MLFSSYTFLFAFLPVTLMGYQIAGRFHRRGVMVWLALMSLVFYAYWQPALVVLLIASITVNYIAAMQIARAIRVSGQGSTRSRIWMWAAIAIDLGALGFFKYLFPFLNFFSDAAHLSRHWTNVVLPLGISFFTFTQIAYIVDLQQGAATLQDFISYVVFVTFFPHLIAGPILHHKSMMPQFSEGRSYKLRLNDFTVGLSWFIMGLAKKVLLADTFADAANLAYAQHTPLGFALAWRGTLSYALQLYFDFSGYSDMALGLARMFSIDFPINFSSPYKATSIIDFWQRWHITLTQYITDYVYSPMQFAIGRRRSAQGKKTTRKALSTVDGFVQIIAMPTLVTMLIAGVWHGAGWQYLVFGLLHGSYIVINHAWRVWRSNHKVFADPNITQRKFGVAVSVLLTFLCVVVSQVFFRSGGCEHAMQILAGIVGVHGLGMQQQLPGDNAIFRTLDWAGIAAGLAVCWALPNTQQILARFKPALELTPWDHTPAPRPLLWFPSVAWGLGLGVVFFLVLVHLQDPTTFLYFQF